MRKNNGYQHVMTGYVFSYLIHQRMMKVHHNLIFYFHNHLPISDTCSFTDCSKNEILLKRTEELRGLMIFMNNVLSYFLSTYNHAYTTRRMVHKSFTHMFHMEPYVSNTLFLPF